MNIINNKKIRNTKIIATLGPATDNPHVLEKMIIAGMDIARINMSHGNNIINVFRIQNLQQLAKKLDQRVDLLIDLSGRKIRIGKFANQKINLLVGHTLILDPDLDPNQGTECSVYISEPNLYKELDWEDLLLLDDGKIILQVELIKSNKIFCVAKNAATLFSNKGVNIQKKRDQHVKAATNKDQEHIILTSQFGIDFFGLSFINNAQDILDLRTIIRSAKSSAKVFAKIETKESIINLDEIIKTADGIMVARGDLMTEVGFSKLAFFQKKITQAAKYFGKPCLVATQVMDSMIENAMPTRAEIMDIANSVIDGARGIVLAAETAIGKHPALVIEYLDEILVEAEKLIVL